LFASFPVSGPVLNSEGLSDGVIFVKFGPPLGSSKYLTIYAGVSAHANNLYSSRDNGAGSRRTLPKCSPLPSPKFPPNFRSSRLDCSCNSRKRACGRRLRDFN
jgi:hypothetical protein